MSGSLEQKATKLSWTGMHAICVLVSANAWECSGGHQRCKGTHVAAVYSRCLFITCAWPARSQTLPQLVNSGRHELEHPMPWNCCALKATLTCKWTVLHLPGLSALLSKGPCRKTEVFRIRQRCMVSSSTGPSYSRRSSSALVERIRHVPSCPSSCFWSGNMLRSCAVGNWLQSSPSTGPLNILTSVQGAGRWLQSHLPTGPCDCWTSAQVGGDLMRVIARVLKVHGVM